MPIRKILYPTKFRDLSFHSLLEFLELKKIGLEEIILLHIIPREEVSFVPFGGYLKDKAIELKEAAILKFKDWAKELHKESVKTKIYVEIGEVVGKILEVLEKEEPDLLIIGKKKTIYPWTASYSKEIIKNSPIPVVLYRRLVIKELEELCIQRENIKIFRKPLLAYDFSKEIKRTILYLLNFKDLIEQVSIIHVLEEKKLKDHSEEKIMKIEKEVEENLIKEKKIWDDLDIYCDYFIRIGNPAEEILELAREKQNTLIVLGKSSKGILSQVFLGSVSAVLIEESEIPLLIVP
ncbi:MAG: universal stress protein [Caldimicrobium sp.]